MYKIKSATEETTVVTCLASDRELTLTTSFVGKHLRLSFCLTMASAQGSTLKGRLRIYSNHPRFNRRHLYVCLSRACAFNLVEVI